MDENLEQNTKLYGFNGFIGRYDFFLNYVYRQYHQLLMRLIFLLAAMAVITVKTASVINENPELSEKFVQFMKNAQQSIYEDYFVSHKITVNENKYHVRPDSLKRYLLRDKLQLIGFAASFAAHERNETVRKQKDDGMILYAKTGELPRTKIYNAQNMELPGEFLYDTEKHKNDDFKTIFAAIMNAYKFYEPS